MGRGRIPRLGGPAIRGSRLRHRARAWATRPQRQEHRARGARADEQGRPKGNPSPGRERMLEQLASYALLDGLIGNTDRHHENWMVAYVPEGNDTVLRSMPSFDHASSLGRELADERRRESPGIGRGAGVPPKGTRWGLCEPADATARRHPWRWQSCCVDGSPTAHAGRLHESRT